MVMSTVRIAERNLFGVKNMSDLIKREDVEKAIRSICDLCGEKKKNNGVMYGACNLDSFIRIFDDITDAKESYEWCTRGEHPCKEYDYENHCCHRWSSFIRETIADMKAHEPERITGNAVHLCKSCKYTYPECPNDGKVIFGDGKGNDNICACSEYEPKSPERKKGRWLPHPGDRDWDVCSVCGTGCKRREHGEAHQGITWETEYNYQYCPNCGARLEWE